MLRAWLILLLLFPLVASGAKRDFAQESSCLGAWGTGTADTIGDWKLDRSPVEQPLVLQNHLAVDVDNAPPLAPSGRDSMKDNGSFPIILSGTSPQDYQPVNMTFALWAQHDSSAVAGLVHRLSGAPAADRLFLWADSSCHVELNDATTDGPSCPTDGTTWFFLALVHGAIDDENILMTSQSTVARTLKDCGSGCAANSTPGTEGTIYHFFLFTDNTGDDRWRGSIAEITMFDIEAAAKDACELCRCGQRGLVRGIGRWAECNACETPVHHRCRRRF